MTADAHVATAEPPTGPICSAAMKDKNLQRL